jgi:ketosteroid isomerase-like protein
MTQLDATTSTRSNADVVGAIYEAFGQGDVPAVLAMFREDITWHIPGRNPLSGDYVGHDEVVSFFQAMGERSDGTFTLDVHDVIGGGADLAVAVVTEHAGRNGARLEDPAIHVWRVEGGKATSFQAFTSDDHAQDTFWA